MKKNIINHHDRFFRSSMSDIRVAKSFFDNHLPSKIKNLVDLKSLKLEPESFIDEKLREKISDILYSVKIGKQTGYFYLLCEHQSHPQELMPFRILKYMIAAKERHLRTYNTKELPLIWPMVFYNGKRAYKHSTNLFDLYPEQYMDMAKDIMLNEFQLIDLNNIPDQKVRSYFWSRLMELYMKAHTAKSHDDFLKSLEAISLVFACLEFEQDGVEYIERSIDYVIMSKGYDDVRYPPTGYLKLLISRLSQNTREKVMTLAELLKKEGREEGIEQGTEQGLEQGLEKGKITIALKMLSEGMERTLIAKITELPLEYIKKLQSQNNKNRDPQ